MNRKLLGLIYWIGGSLVALFGVLLAIPLVVHPNEYRTPIATLVKNITGRQLTIRGDVGLTVFPNLGMILRDVSLANAADFGPDPMAQVTTVEVGVKFMPLLSGRVEVERAEMMGLSLFLHRNGAGLSNWDDLLARLNKGMDKPADKPDGEPTMAGVAAEKKEAASVVPVSQAIESDWKTLLVGGVEVVGARLYWRDEMIGRDYKVDNLDLKVGPMQQGRPVPVVSGFRFSEASHQLQGRADVKYQVRVVSGHYFLDGLDVSMQASAMGQRFKEGQGRLLADVEVDVGSGQVVFSKTEWTTHLWTTEAWLRDVLLGFQGRMEWDWARQRLMAPQSLFTALIKANALPPAGVQVKVKSDLTGDRMAQTVQMKNLVIEGPAGVRLSGSMMSEDLFTAPVTRGKLSVGRFDFRTLLIALGRTIPANRDDKVCSGLEAEFDFALSGEEIAVSQVKIGLDESRLTGNLAWNPAGPAIRFAGVVDTLNLDLYLPMLTDGGQSGHLKVEAAQPDKPAVDKQATVGGERSAPSARESSQTLPLNWLTPELVLNGEVKIGQLVAGKGRYTDVNAVVTAREGQLNIDPLSLTLYGGQMESKMRLDARDAVPRVRVDQTLKGVQAGALLQDMAQWSGVTGRGDWSAHLEAEGRDREALTRTLNGDVRLVMADGVIPGLDVVGRIRKAYATFKRVPVAASGGDEAAFSALTATATIRNGVLDNQDLVIQSPVLLMNGAGQVDFVQQRVDYLLKADVATTLQGVTGDAQKYQGLTLPVRLRSSFDSIKKFDVGTVDFSQMAVNTLRERVMDKVGDKLSEEEQDKINRGLERLEEKWGAPVNQLLRKFLRQ